MQIGILGLDEDAGTLRSKKIRPGMRGLGVASAHASGAYRSPSGDIAKVIADPTRTSSSHYRLANVQKKSAR